MSLELLCLIHANIMIPLLLSCLAVIAIAGLVMYLSPQFAPFSVGIMAVSAVILLQSLLLRLVGSFVKQDATGLVDDVPKSNVSEIEALKTAYQKFRLFLARATGLVGFLYGVVTSNVYYILLGAAAMILFWIWDRMGQPQEDTPSMPTEQENQADHFNAK